MSDERKRIGDLFGVIANASAEICRLMGGTMASGANGGGSVASDRDLDDPKWGDQVVKFDPKRWTEQGGESYKGAKWSECSPDFLDVLAEVTEYQAANPKPGKEQYAKHDAKNASRIRGWAKRLRNGWKPIEIGGLPPTSSFGDSSVFDAGGGGAPDASFEPDDF